MPLSQRELERRYQAQQEAQTGHKPLSRDELSRLYREARNSTKLQREKRLAMPRARAPKSQPARSWADAPDPHNVARHRASSGRKTAHVPAGHANGGQFTGGSNPPRPANPSTKGYERMRAGRTTPILQPFSKTKEARLRAEARNVERVRRLEGKMDQAWAELQLARRAGDRERIAAWAAETRQRAAAYMDAYREEAKARGVKLPATLADKRARAAEAELRKQAANDREGRRVEARREAYVSRSVFPKLVEASRAQGEYDKGRRRKESVNRLYAEHEEAFQASVARRMGEGKPKRARKLSDKELERRAVAAVDKADRTGSNADASAADKALRDLAASRSAPQPKRTRARKASAPKSRPYQPPSLAVTIYEQIEYARMDGNEAEAKRLEAIVKRRKNVANNKPAPPPRKRKPGPYDVPRQGRRTRRNTQQRAEVYSEARRGLGNRRARGA